MASARGAWGTEDYPAASPTLAILRRGHERATIHPREGRRRPR